MNIGYARISTREQDTTIQEEALKRAGCSKIFVETITGGRWDRPQLQRVLEQVREGDVLVVHKLDRLSRNLKDLLLILEKLKDLKVGFLSLSEAIDTTTPGGMMMLQMLGSFAEFERTIIRDRTQIGIKKAREEGRYAGRPSKINDAQKKEILRALENEEKTQAELARLFNVTHSVINRLVAKQRVKTFPPAFEIIRTSPEDIKRIKKKKYKRKAFSK